MWIKEIFVFFLSLALGYILCVIAKKQTSVLKTLGYTLGIAAIVMTFLYALLESQYSMNWKGRGCMNGKMMRCVPMKHHR